MIRQMLSSPSGRLSSRRALFSLAVVVALGCAVAAVALDHEIKPGVVSVLASTTAATAAAAGLGRFAERGTEKVAEGSESELEQRRRA